MHALFLRKLLFNQLIRNEYSWGNLSVWPYLFLFLLTKRLGFLPLSFFLVPSLEVLTVIICFWRLPKPLPKNPTPIDINNFKAYRVCIPYPTIPVPVPPRPRGSEPHTPPPLPYPWPHPGEAWFSDIKAATLVSVGALASIEAHIARLPDNVTKPLQAALSQAAEAMQTELPEGYELRLGQATGADG